MKQRGKHQKMEVSNKAWRGESEYVTHGSSVRNLAFTVRERGSHWRIQYGSVKHNMLNSITLAVPLRNTKGRRRWEQEDQSESY